MAKMGRPKRELDWNDIEICAAYKMTKEDTAAIAGCSPDLLEIEIKKKYGTTFSAFREQKLARTRYRLVGLMMEKAERGDNTMIIFALKNLHNFADNPTKGFIPTEDK